MRHLGATIAHIVLFALLVLAHRRFGVFELPRIDVEPFPEENVLTILAVVFSCVGEVVALLASTGQWRIGKRIIEVLVGAALLAFAAWRYGALRSDLEFPQPKLIDRQVFWAAVAFCVAYFALGIIMEGLLSLLWDPLGNDHPPKGPEGAGIT